MRISDFRGRVVFLEFWATWCGPCQEPMKRLLELARRRGEAWRDDVALVAIGIDKHREDLLKHVRQNGASTVRQLWSPQNQAGFAGSAGKDYFISGVPTSFLIGRDGRIIWRGHPASIELERKIDELIGPKPAPPSERGATGKPAPPSERGSTGKPAPPFRTGVHGQACPPFRRGGHGGVGAHAVPAQPITASLPTSLPPLTKGGQGGSPTSVAPAARVLHVIHRHATPAVLAVKELRNDEKKCAIADLSGVLENCGVFIT